MADENEEDAGVGHPYGRIRKGPLVFSRNEDDEKAMRRLIEIEPEISTLVASRRAWALVIETVKKIALLLTALSGGFFVLREVIRSMAG